MKISVFIKKILNKNFLFDLALGLAAFLLPFIALIVVFSINKFALNNHDGYTIISFDMQSQYIAILKNYKYVITHNESLVYSTMRLFGGEYLSIFAYYVSSPFNLLTIFIKDADLPLFFVWGNIIKMSFASLNMYLLLRITTKEKNIGYLAFSFGYGLISYFMAEMHNFMWFDCIMILPLVVLGVRLLEEGKHHWLYAVTLAYALMTSWYIGALMCMFLVIFFVYRVIALNGKKERLAFTYRFSATSVVGGFLAGVFWVTAFLHLAGTKAKGGLPELHYFSPSMYFVGFLTNNFPSVEVIMNNSGWCTMFTSVVTLVMAQLFVLNPHYSKRERYGALAIFVGYFLVVTVNTLNAMFHGGQEPSWFPTRYSFMIGFLVCYFGALEFRKIGETKEWHLAIPVGVMILVLLLVCNVKNDILVEAKLETYTINYLGLGLYLGTIVATLVYLLVKNRLHFDNKWVYMGLSGLIVVLTAISSSSGADSTLKTYIRDNHVQKYPTYIQDMTYQDAVDKVKSLEPNDNYRMELTSNRPGNYNLIDNNPFFYNYSGFCHYTSNAKKNVKDYFWKLGYHNNDYFEKFEGGATVSVSSLLGLKYLIDEPGNYTTDKPVYVKNYPFVELTNISTSERDLKFYKNDYFLPFGYAVNNMDYSWINEGIRDYYPNGETYWFNHFEYHNEIFKTFVSDVVDSSNKQKDIFVPCTITDIQVGSGLTQTIDEKGFHYYEGKGTITYTIEEPAGGENNNFYYITRDGYYWIQSILDYNWLETSTYWHNGIRGFSHTNNGQHRLQIKITEEQPKLPIEPVLYMEQVDVLGEYINKIKQQASFDMKAIKSKFSYKLEGTFELTKENQNFIFTLPFEEDFKVYVDGKVVNAETRWNIFTGVSLKGYSLGKHTIKLVYSDHAFVYGFLITNLGIGGLVGIYLVEKKISNKKKKQTEEN